MQEQTSSNSQEANVPKLRFPGFEGEWKTVVLSDFTERVTRKNVNNESNLPLTISSKDGLVDQISYFNKPVASRDMSGYYLLHNGEFAYNKSYSVGYDFGSIKRLDIYPKGALSTLYICFALKKYDSDFIKIYFDSLKWYREICMIAAEGARNHGLLNVSADAFFATKHILPQNEKEQKKIATFMVLLEKRVVLQQQLVDALKSYKRGALSRLFPKNGASVPEYRFSGFTGDWEQRKLGEVANRVQGNDGRMDLNTLTISAGNGWMKQEDRFSSNIAGKEQQNYTLLKKGELSYNHGNSKLAKYGTVFELRDYEEALVPRVYHSFRVNSKADAGFVEYMFATKLPDRELGKLISSGARMDGLLNIGYDEFMSINIMMPSVREQVRIRDILRQMDTLITLHQRKLDEYKSIKQGLLEKLFI